MAIVPGYISRSVAGSYDNEGIAIFALLFTYFLWLKSVKTGSVFWSVAASLSYFYMVGRVWWGWWECACVGMVEVCICGDGGAHVWGWGECMCGNGGSVVWMVGSACVAIVCVHMCVCV